MDWAQLVLQLMKCGAISSFRPADEINPEYIGGNCPPIGVAQSQAFEVVLFPILVKYHHSRRQS
jgi:hypothetical protein